MKAQSILWQISGVHDKASYLLGTVHIRSTFAFRAFPQFQNLISACDLYAGESNLDDLGDFQLDGQFDPDYAARYQALLSENQYAHLDRLIKKQVPQLKMWPYLHPMLLMSQIESALMGHDEAESLDLALWEFAKAEGKDLVGIESAALQRQIFNEMDLDAAFQNIKHTIAKMHSLRKNYKKIAHYYQNQDIHALYLKAKKQLGKMKRPMLYDRNVYMADRIETLVQDQSVFVGIGVGHLPGEKGVLRLLKHKGFTLKPVQIQAPNPQNI